MPALSGACLGLLNVFDDSKCLHNYLCGTVVIFEAEEEEMIEEIRKRGTEREPAVIGLQ